MKDLGRGLAERKAKALRGRKGSFVLRIGQCTEGRATGLLRGNGSNLRVSGSLPTEERMKFDFKNLTKVRGEGSGAGS